MVSTGGGAGRRTARPVDLIMAWFRKTKKPKPVRMDRPRSTVPEGLWVKCDDCKEIVYRKEVEQNFNVCPKCGYHFRLSARERFEILFDDGKYKEFAGDIRSADPLEFRDTKRYRDRLKVYEASASAKATPCCAPRGSWTASASSSARWSTRFMGGSMGSVVGEKITRAVERARGAQDAADRRSPPPAARACRKGSSR